MELEGARAEVARLTAGACLYHAPLGLDTEQEGARTQEELGRLEAATCKREKDALSAELEGPPSVSPTTPRSEGRGGEVISKSGPDAARECRREAGRLSAELEGARAARVQEAARTQVLPCDCLKSDSLEFRFLSRTRLS